MTVKELRAKRERKNKRKEMVIVGISIVGMFLLMAGFVRAWDKEIQIQTQKNIEWQTTYSR